MSTPVHGLSEPQFSSPHSSNVRDVGEQQDSKMSWDDTFVVNTQRGDSPEPRNRAYKESLDIQRPGYSLSHLREENSRMKDNLEMLRAERVVSAQEAAATTDKEIGVQRSRSQSRFPRSSIEEQRDDYNNLADPIHNVNKGIWSPPEKPATKVARMFKRIHDSSTIVRYFTYIIPVTLILLVPLLLGALKYKKATVGGVKLVWFCVWLLIIWLSLWAGRICAKLIPYPAGVLFSLFTNNSKKWRDMTKMLEVPVTLFLWWLAVFISFLPIVTNHTLNGDTTTKHWELIINKLLISVFVAMCLNLLSKIIIQLIAISFHQRTYEDRISLNKFQIGSLAKLYQYSRDFHIDVPNPPTITSGARTPQVYLKIAKEGAQTALHKTTDVLGRVAADFTGRAVHMSTSPHQVVLNLLSTNDTAMALARRLFRTFIRDDNENVSAEDLTKAFDSEEEAEAAFTMFDRDLNGDISCEEMEMACTDIARERKSIVASLKDLDSVIGKLDDVFTFIIIVITVLVFIAIYSTSTATILSSASTSVLALSWLFSATAQEFLQSIVFVFVKHPFDCGDRVDIMVNGEVTSYFVKEISLMYTELKRMEGHIVQAPNSLLNTLFILNMRRSPALAEAVPITIKFGTTLEQIEELRKRLIEFVTLEKRDYKPTILTELRKIDYLHQVTLNVVFFYKSNWQNELLRLQRRNKFMCALMCHITDIGIESPHKRWPGQSPDTPMYLSNIHQAQYRDNVQNDILDERTKSPSGNLPPVFPRNNSDTTPAAPPTSILRTQSNARRPRADSVAEQQKHVDFSLGAGDISLSDSYGEAFDTKPTVPVLQLARLQEEELERRSSRGSGLERVTSRTSSVSVDSQSNPRRRDRWIRHENTLKEEEDLESGLRPPETTPAPTDAALNTVVSPTTRVDSNDLRRYP